MTTDYTTFRTRLIDAIEALQRDNISQYGVVLEMGQHMIDPLAMSAVQQIFEDMGVKRTDLDTWYRQYIAWSTRAHVSIAYGPTK